MLGSAGCDQSPTIATETKPIPSASPGASPRYTTTPEDEWVNALKKGTRSGGCFERVETLAEAVTLANIALRVPYKRLLWDAQKVEFTNSPEANKLIRREYRQGWERLIV